MKNKGSRRKLLKSIAAGSGAVVAGKSLPESWSKPIVNAVMLPVHAETTNDSDSGSEEATTSTTTTTMAPCVIEGTYCWIEGSNAHTIIAVTSDGDITINRTFIDPAISWTGTGTASNGAMGGTFSIHAPSDGDYSARDYTGTIACNSSSIEAIVTTPSGTTASFKATQAACSQLPS